MPSSLRLQESEATRFAGSLLLPHSQLLSMAQEVNLSQFFEGIDRFELSAAASVLRLRTLLLPGFIFFYELGGSLWSVQSPRTSFREDLSRQDSEKRLKLLAKESGQIFIGAKSVRWYRIADYVEFTMPEDDRLSPELLKSSLNRCEPLAGDTRYKSMNGIVGGLLSAEDATDRSATLTALIHKIDAHPNISHHLTSDPDFQLWLRRRVDERVSKLQAK